MLTQLPSELGIAPVKKCPQTFSRQFCRRGHALTRQFVATETKERQIDTVS
jgi:hypothetical protein